MHPNPIYHTADATRNLAYARDRAFGVLAVNGPEGPLMSHLPFLLSEDGSHAELHLVRSNPIARSLKDGDQSARLGVTGPDSYISPDWYGVADQVPTWNYIAVHLTGTLSLMNENDLHDLLDRQAALFEERLAPKKPWTTAKMSDGVMERLMRAIVPCRMKVSGVDGTWKLNQNKDDAVRLKAASHVEAYGMGSEHKLLSALMRGVGADRKTKGDQ